MTFHDKTDESDNTNNISFGNGTVIGRWDDERKCLHFFFTVKCVLGVGTVDNLFLFALVSTFFFYNYHKIVFVIRGKRKNFLLF